MASPHDASIAVARLASVLACPVCGDPLRVVQSVGIQLMCAVGHGFDVARTGYVNLLLANQRRSTAPGYTQETLRARRTVLAAGLLDPLVPSLAESIVPAVTGAFETSHTACLDAGCGEGHLFSQLLTAVQSMGGVTTNGIGIDISKAGIKMASTLDRTIAWCVANLTRTLPIRRNAIGVLANVLAPLNAAEFRRVLLEDGLLLKVVPSEGHLRELRAALYEIAAPGPSLTREVESQLAPFFVVTRKQRLNWVWRVAGVSTRDLLMMSPLFWKAKQSKVWLTEQEGLTQLTVDLEALVARPR